MKNIEKHLKIGIYTCVFTLLVVGCSVAFYVYISWQNSSRVTQADVAYREALTAQVGRPVEVTNKYVSEKK